MEEKIIYADKGSLKKILLVFLLVGILSLILVQYISSLVQQLDVVETQQMAIEKLIFIFRTSTLLFSVVLVFFGIYLFYVGVRVTKSNQFPPPGMKVFRDTKVSTGSRAKAFSILLIVSSFISIICGVIVYAYASSIINNIQKSLTGL